jgi:hypothetical protein
MPRKKISVEAETTSTGGRLVERLAKELRSDRESGQPLIYEKEFHTGKIQVAVIWDEWDRMPLDERSSVILRAYELAEGAEFKNRVALPSGLTFPEAHATGMLPYTIIPGLRPGDSVTREQVRRAMLEEGASELVVPDTPVLGFATKEEAEASRKRLAERLPGSEPIWIIARAISGQDTLVAQEWADASA